MAELCVDCECVNEAPLDGGEVGGLFFFGKVAGEVGKGLVVVCDLFESGVVGEEQVDAVAGDDVCVKAVDLEGCLGDPDGGVAGVDGEEDARGASDALADVAV